MVVCPIPYVPNDLAGERLASSWRASGERLASGWRAAGEQLASRERLARSQRWRLRASGWQAAGERLASGWRAAGERLASGWRADSGGRAAARCKTPPQPPICHPTLTSQKEGRHILTANMPRLPQKLERGWVTAGGRGGGAGGRERGGGSRGAQKRRHAETEVRGSRGARKQRRVARARQRGPDCHKS